VGWTEDGVWKPWRHPDYRDAESDLQGWWRHQGTGDVIAVLEETTSTTGKPMVQAAKYNFNEDTRGNGLRLLTATLQRHYVRESDDLDPPDLTA
jgi:hypothetical protein